MTNIYRLRPCPECGHTLDPALAIVDEPGTHVTLHHVRCPLCAYASPVRPHAGVAVAVHNQVARERAQEKMMAAFKEADREVQRSRSPWPVFWFTMALMALGIALLLPGCARTPEAPPPTAVAAYMRNIRGEPRMVKRFPAIITQSPVLSASAGDALHRAAQYWNCALGYKVFTFYGPYLDAQILATNETWPVYSKDGVRVQRTGYFLPKVDFDGFVYFARISADVDYLEEKPHRLERTWRHELGHVLGLAHLQAGYGVMASHPDSTEPTEVDKASPDSLRLLRELYGFPAPTYPPEACEGTVLEIDPEVFSLIQDAYWEVEQ
jgi:hypothetical protein